MIINDDKLIDYLEELAESVDIEIRHEIITQDEDLPFVAGGLCLLEGKYVVIVNPKASVKERIKVLAMAVKHADLNQVYVRPVLRELLDGSPEQKPVGNAYDEISDTR